MAQNSDSIMVTTQGNIDLALKCVSNIHSLSESSDPRLDVKKYTHQELYDLVASGKISQSKMDEEMLRRKQRKEQRKKMNVKSTFQMVEKGVVKAEGTLTQRKTKLSQIVHDKPLTPKLIEDMLVYESFGPWWRAKMFEVLRMPVKEVTGKLNHLAYTPYKSGTVEFWHNLLWGSRRKRDKFIDLYFYASAQEEDDEPCITQGDEPVLEEESSLAGNANITFVEERSTDADASHVSGSVSTKDQHCDMAETPWNQMREVLEREIVVHQGTWTPTTKTEFLSLGFPKCTTDKLNSFIRRQLSFFAFLRAGYEFRIQFNGNRFALGSLVFAVVPPMFEEDTGNYTWNQMFNFPHIRVDASVSNVGTLFVPFTHLLSHFPQRKGSLESDSIVTLGRLVGVVINPLLVGDGATNSLRYTIYGRFVNPEVHQTTWPISEFSYSDGIFTQGEEGLFKKIIGGGLSTALGAFLSKMTGGLATGIGGALAGLIFDYPRDPVPAEPIVNQSVGPVCYGAGVDHSIRLALTPVSQTETPAQLLGSTNGDFDMKVLLQIPSLLDQVAWTSGDQQGQLLFQMPVTPCFLPNRRIEIGSKRTVYTPTMQAYISRAFCYWRGTIVIKIQFIKTEFNNGRVLLSYSPHINGMQLPDDATSENIDTFNQANAMIVDIEEQKEVVVELPYMSPRPWLRCDALRPGASFAGKDSVDTGTTFLAESHCGYFSMHVLNTLTSPSNVPQDIQVNFLISVGQDFELAYPTMLAPLNITSFGVGSASSYEEYPFVLGTDMNTLNQVSFENKEWILAAFYEGKRLHAAGKLVMPAGAKWWFEAQPQDYLGTTDEETLVWLYKVEILKKYRSLNSGETNVQTLYMFSLGLFSDEDRLYTQGLEEYTTTRVSSPSQITITKGHKMCEVAPQTVSENGMNLQTILRRFYCIYTSPPLFHYSGYTMVAVPVNPSFTPVARHPINTNKGTFFAEPVPMDQVAWFTKLFTYWRGSLRYKLVFDSNFYDVVAVHVPTECANFGITYGVKEVDVTRIMSYAGVVATSVTQGALEVEVPYAAPYEQQLIDVHNKYFDLRCQNGTLFFLFRNKVSGQTNDMRPTSFQLYRSTGDDFVMNVPRAPPQIDEPQITYGACRGSSVLPLIVKVPEAIRNLGNNSQKLTMPTSTGLKYISSQGHMAQCVPEDPVTQGLEERAEAQMFSSFKNIREVSEAIQPAKVTAIVDNLEKSTSSMANIAATVDNITADIQIKETLQSLNGVSSKVDKLLGGVTSIANGVHPSQENLTKYAIIASEVLLCGTFVHQVRCTLVDPTLPNFCTLAIELGLIVGLSVSETMQSLIASVVNWAMNFEILPKVPEPQSLDQATDFLEQNQTILCSVVAVIGTVLYAYLFEVIPPLEKIKAAIKSFFESDDEITSQGLEKTFGFSLRNAHFSVLGISALEKVYTKITDWVQRLVYWFLDQENPQVMLARVAVELKDRVLKVITELDELDYEPSFMQAMSDPLVHNRFYRLQQEVKDLTAECLNNKVDGKVVALLTECRKRSQRLMQRLEKEACTSTTRYDPFVVCLHGDAGVGKSAFALEVLKIYKEVMGLSDYHLLFPKGIHDKYWSGYTRQPVVLWDDYGQSVEADKLGVPEFMTLRSSRPVKVNMSDNAEKGRDFTSQGIILTTNVPYQDFNSIRDNVAHRRRRHVMVGMQLAPGYTPDRVSGLEKEEYETYAHARFSITQNQVNEVIERNQTPQQVLDYIRVRMTAWHQKQLDILNAHEPDELPRGIVPVPEDEIPAEDLAELERAAAAEMANDAEQEQEPEEEMFWDAAGEAGVPEEIPEAQGRVFPRINQVVGRRVWFRVDPDFVFENDTEKYLADLFLARMECETAWKVWMTYTKARSGVKKFVSRMYTLAQDMFKNLKDMVLDFWKNNTRLCKILGVLGVLTTLGTVMHFRTPAHTEAYESGPTRASKIRTVAESYESGPTKASKIRIVAEGSDDPQTVDIARKIKQYVYPLAWSEGMSRDIKMSALHIGGHLIVAPSHFFTHAVEGEWFELKHRNRPVKIEFLKERMSQLGDKDWVVYNCGIRLEAGKHLMKFFIEEKSLNKVGNSKCVLVTRDPVDWEIETKHGNVKPVKEFSYTDPIHGDTFKQRGWEHTIDTRSGNCGSPLLIVNSAVPSPGKILGIHVAGYKTKSIGYTVLITREQLEKAIAPFGIIPSEAPIAQCVEVGYSPALRIIPTGDFTLVGKMPDRLAPAQPLKTTLEPTPFHDEVVALLGPAQKKPAHLKQFEKDGQKISPLKNAIVKYGHLTIPYPRRNIQKVKMFLIHYFDQKLKHHTGRRVFSEAEAVNGLPGVEFAEKLNFKSSPGWPYQMETKTPGKWHLFDEEGNIIDDKLKERVRERREKAKKLERVTSIWRDCLKDELRPLNKVDNGKTRLFTIAPVDFTIVTRQMFLDFVMAFYSAQNETFFSSVGINPESMDWTRLYNYLAEKNNQVIAGDYECFDGKEMPEIIEMVGEVISAWYGGDEEDYNIRKTLFEEIVHTMQLCENTVYMTHMGNPSGNPLTTIINTIVNFSLMALTWLEIYPHSSVAEFEKHVNFKAYGDDNALSVEPKFQDTFHQNSIANALLDHNIVYTAESKSDAEVPNTRPLDEISFLKRGFRRDTEFGRAFVLPTMSIETLNSYFYYVRKSSNLEEQLQENQRSALMFAAFHGREFYEKYLGMWKELMKKANLESLHISFEEQVDSFLYNAGVLEHRNTTRTGNGIVLEGMETFMKFTNSKPVRLVCGATVAPLYACAALLGIGRSERITEPIDDRWAIAIPSGEGKSFLCRTYPWLFADHDDLLLPKFKENRLSLPWNSATASEIDFPKEDRRVLLVHHPNNTKRRLVGSFITPFPTFIRMNCIQRLRMKDPTKITISDRNILLVQLCSSLEPSLRRNHKGSELTAYTHGSSCLNRLAEHSCT